MRKWIRRMETNLMVSPSDHLIVFFVFQNTQKKNQNCYCKNSPRVYYHAVDTVLRVHSGVVERLLLWKVCLVGCGGRLVGK